LNNLNNNYLSIRTYLVNKLFTFTVQTAISIMMKLDKPENKLQQKTDKKDKKKSFDIDKFLDKLEN